MSIIFNALKKVQQGLKPKPNEPPVSPSTADQNPSANLFETPVPVEKLQPDDKQAAERKQAIQNKIKSFLALACSIAITIGSVLYIFQQFQNKIPQVERLAKKSFFKLIHKEEVPAFKTKAPKDLVPLAKITINQPAAPAPATLAAPPNTAKPDAPITLNIHGIVADGTKSLVLINNQIYQEGDEVDGAKIVKINLNSITVINNGVKQTISVKD